MKKNVHKVRYSFFCKTVSALLILCLLVCNYSQMIVIAADELHSDNIQFEYPSPSDYTDEEDEISPDDQEEILLNEPELTDSYDSFEMKYGSPVSVSQHEKTYQTSSESYLTVLSMIPNTYLDTRGREHKIDNTLVRKTSFFTGAYYQNKANSYVVRLPEEMNYDNGAEYISSGVDIELIPLEGSYTRPVALENAVLYNQVFDDVDVQYSIYETHVKEYIILNKQTDKNSFTYELVANNSDAEVIDNTIVITKNLPLSFS